MKFEDLPAEPLEQVIELLGGNPPNTVSVSETGSFWGFMHDVKRPLVAENLDHGGEDRGLIPEEGVAVLEHLVPCYLWLQHTLQEEGSVL